MKNEFLNFVHQLMETNPEITAKYMNDYVQSFLTNLEEEISQKPEITEKGIVILEVMQNSRAKIMKAKDIAEALNMASKSVSGSLRKLVNDGFVEKIGDKPISYTLTEKGQNYDITNKENEE